MGQSSTGDLGKCSSLSCVQRCRPDPSPLPPPHHRLDLRLAGHVRATTGQPEPTSPGWLSAPATACRTLSSLQIAHLTQKPFSFLPTPCLWCDPHASFGEALCSVYVACWWDRGSWREPAASLCARAASCLPGIASSHPLPAEQASP